MTSGFILLTIITVGSIIGGLLFVIFSNTTVRKLRKNPATKDHLGVQFISSWDALNVAQTLSLPRLLARKLDKSPLSTLEANSEVLYRHTNLIDRIFARVFYFFFVVTGLRALFLGVAVPLDWLTFPE